MGTISNQLDKLKISDTWSFILFALFKIKEKPEYSALSELAFVLDKDSLLNLCEFFGGLTITIPTIEELEDIVNALLLYQFIDIEHKDFDSSVEYFKQKQVNCRKLKDNYFNIKQILETYEFKSRGKV